MWLACKGDSVFCVVSFIELSRKKARWGANRFSRIFAFSVFSWNPGESDLLSAFTKNKDLQVFEALLLLGFAMVLVRSQSAKNFEDDVIIIPCPSKQLNQPDHAVWPA